MGNNFVKLFVIFKLDAKRFPFIVIVFIIDGTFIGNL